MATCRQVHTALGVVVAALALSCSEPEQPAAVTVTPAASTLDAVGATLQLKAVVTGAKGNTLTDAIVTWASSNSAVASVDASGLVTGLAAGSSDVTASVGTVSGKGTITVAPAANKVEAAAGAQQTGTVGQALPQQIVVLVKDRLDHALAGATVTFAVSDNGGTVSPANGTTGTDGQLAATWTLGTKSGDFQVSASVSGSGLTALFHAKATPGAANNLAKAGGDNQFGFHDARLAQLVAVRVRDQYGNGIPTYQVQFAADPGGGTADSNVAITDTAGVARTGWVMPSTLGVVTLKATAQAAGGGPLLGSPASFSATSHNVQVSAISPTTLLEGQSATLTGSGFDDATPSQNVVTVDGAAATVTLATATQLTVTVPTYDCRPARSVTVQVTVGGIPAAPVTAPLSPAVAALSLVTGQQAILTDPTQFCFQFAAASAEEAYLVGVQSASEVVSNLTSVKLVSTAAAPAAAPPFASAPAFGSQMRPLPAQVVERLARWRRHAAAELRRREFDRQTFEALRSPAGQRAPQPAARVLVGPSVAEGDTVKGVRVAGTGNCSTYTEITTVARAVGTNGVFLEDIANPVGGYAQSNFASFSQVFDSKIYPTLVTEFGAPGDADGNGRVVIVVTQEVNKLGGGELGFVTSCDLAAPSPSTASNGGEYTYIVAPDPNGVANAQFAYSLEDATRDFPDLIAHEPAHIIQFTRRQMAGGGFLSVWLAEGQAVLGEEVVGRAVEGHAAGEILGFKEAVNLDDTLSSDYFSLGFSGLGLYFGWDPLTVPGSHLHLSNAPWECSWLGTDYGGPCVGDLEPYGAPWALLRYISDRFGNEATLQKAIIDNTLNGYTLLQSLTGVRIDSLLAQFGAMLFADDSVPGAAAELTMSSWDLHDVFYGTYQGFGLRPQLRLSPVSMAFATATTGANVRAASAYYAVIAGGNRPATSLKARDASGSGILPSHMRYWIVRIQ